MTHFAVGEQVVIRWGKQGGQKATVIKILLADAYKVRIEDGAVRYFSGKGLERRTAQPQESA